VLARRHASDTTLGVVVDILLVHGLMHSVSRRGHRAPPT
jgi:hypothetical protein